jgi:hypothetical protein
LISHNGKSALFSLFLLILLTAPASFGPQPSLHGRLFIATPRGTAALHNATIRLLGWSTHEIRAQTYSDSRGNFAFYNLSSGSYEIVVLLGNSILKQKMGTQLIDTLPIQFSGGSLEVPDITVESR